MKPINIVWLVDDDPIFVSLTRKMMDKIHFTGITEVFLNGQLALERLRQIGEVEGDLPQVIFLDLMMPVLDGWGFLDEYREMAESIKRNITLYILSSSDSPQDKKRASKNLEISGFITKPISRSKFNEIAGSIVPE